jgi:hypothetical protein
MGSDSEAEENEFSEKEMRKLIPNLVGKRAQRRSGRKKRANKGKSKHQSVGKEEPLPPSVAHSNAKRREGEPHCHRYFSGKRVSVERRLPCLEKPKLEPEAKERVTLTQQRQPSINGLCLGRPEQPSYFANRRSDEKLLRIASKGWSHVEAEAALKHIAKGSKRNFSGKNFKIKAKVASVTHAKEGSAWSSKGDALAQTSCHFSRK